MTETDATRRPLGMPERYIPYLDRYRIFLLFKEMMQELIIELPKDHLKFMKKFVVRNKNSSIDTNRVMMLVSPEVKIDITKLVKELVKDMGYFVITRRLLLDRYEKHNDYEPGCISAPLLADVTKSLALKEHIQSTGWLMFDHPCTFREARCLQQVGVLPTVTLVLIPAPTSAVPTHDAQTPARGFFQQDFEGLKFAYKATLKEVYVNPETTIEELTERCTNAVHACASGLQGPGQGFNIVGAPGVYRVLIIGPRGSGRRTQARMLANHFGLVYLNYLQILRESQTKNDEIGEKLRKYGESPKLKADIVCRRLLQKDCIDHGWALTGYPLTGDEFEVMDNMPTPPNRYLTTYGVIILNVDIATCKKRAVSVGVDWCTGQRAPVGSGPRVVPHPGVNEAEIDAELELYTDAVAELRAAAGMTAEEINTTDLSIEEIQTKIQAAVIAAPSYNIEPYQPLKNRELRVD